MELVFSQTEKTFFLQKRGYTIARMPCKYIQYDGPHETEMDTEIVVAFRKKDWVAMEALFMIDDLQTYSLNKRFEDELKIALIKL